MEKNLIDWFYLKMEKKFKDGFFKDGFFLKMEIFSKIILFSKMKFFLRMHSTFSLNNSPFLLIYYLFS